MKKRKLIWLGHKLRLLEGTPELAFKEHLKNVKSNQGRPKRTWIKHINKDLKPIHKTVDKLFENGYERKKWTRTMTRLMS